MKQSDLDPERLEAADVSVFERIIQEINPVSELDEDEEWSNADRLAPLCKDLLESGCSRCLSLPNLR